jgi:hypothetical protein
MADSSASPSEQGVARVGWQPAAGSMNLRLAIASHDALALPADECRRQLRAGVPLSFRTMSGCGQDNRMAR